MGFLKEMLLQATVVAAFLISANALSCFGPCNSEDCPEVQCAEGVGKRWDVCGCCMECAKAEGETCGGLWDTNGYCDEGLTCAAPIVEELNPAYLGMHGSMSMGYEPGICQDSSTIHLCQLPGRPDCSYRGVCQPDGDDYRCLCMFPFVGKDCDQVPPDPCLSNPCQNGGDCMSNGFDSFFCGCLWGTTGEFCEIKIPDPCESDPCQNGGDCLRLFGEETGSFVCGCYPGTEGEFCEIKKEDPCKQTPNPCGSEDCFCSWNIVVDEPMCACPIDAPDFLGYVPEEEGDGDEGSIEDEG